MIDPTTELDDLRELIQRQAKRIEELEQRIEAIIYGYSAKYGDGVIILSDINEGHV